MSSPGRRRTISTDGLRVATSHGKASIRDVEELDDLLSEPTEDVTRALASLEGDVLILGVGGKMGPTMARMARRASFFFQAA